MNDTAKRIAGIIGGFAAIILLAGVLSLQAQTAYAVDMNKDSVVQDEIEYFDLIPGKEYPCGPLEEMDLRTPLEKIRDDILHFVKTLSYCPWYSTIPILLSLLALWLSVKGVLQDRSDRQHRRTGHNNSSTNFHSE